MRAWLFQDPKQLAKLGDKCPWSVGFYDPNGKRRQKRIGSHSQAEKFARKVEGELAASLYKDPGTKTWAEFRAEFEAKTVAGMAAGNRKLTLSAMDSFERIVRPGRMRSITTQALAGFVSARRHEPAVRRWGIKPDAKPVSPATINRELRHLRAVLRKAHSWGYLPTVPQFEFLREPDKLATYVTPEDFRAIYGACDKARWPADEHYPAADWWRGLMMLGYMTGWRIGSIMALRWEDTDLERGTALSRAADNKGNRDQFVPLHALVVEHLRPLVTFSEMVFPWPHSRNLLDTQFHAIQRAAKVEPLGRRWYGFHDLRRAFATLNAERMTPDALQSLMQHKDYTTTKRYISMARQLNPAVANLFVPDLPKRSKANA